MKKSINKKNTAFTIIELSVVILIIALLMFGSFSSSGIANSAKEKVTRDRMRVIYEAMGNFLLQKKRLPCPASILLSRGDTDYGKEIRTESGDCYDPNKGVYPSNAPLSSNLIFGMVPISELNLGADFGEDAFGNKINYFMDKNFGSNYIEVEMLDPFLSIPSFGTANFKDVMIIKERNQGGEVVVNSDAIVVLMSAGSNGFGVFKNTGIKNPRSSNIEEVENDVFNIQFSNSENFNKIFYKDFESEEFFDDIIMFKTRNDFVNDFNLKSLIPCRGTDINDNDFNKISKYYGQGLNASSPCPLTSESESIIKTLKCDSFGRWIKLVPACPGISIQTCTVGGIEGMKSKVVNANSSAGDGECEVDYKGSYSWSCTTNQSGSAGTGAVVNNCFPYCVFPQENGMLGQKGAPGESGAGSCSAGYNGYYTWSCNSSGVGSVVNNCILQ